jgi:hypothetical protein
MLIILLVFAHKLKRGSPQNFAQQRLTRLLPAKEVAQRLNRAKFVCQCVFVL